MNKEEVFAAIREQVTVNELRYMLIEREDIRFDYEGYELVLSAKHWDRFYIRVYKTACCRLNCNANIHIAHASEIFPTERWLLYPDCRCGKIHSKESM